MTGAQTSSPDGPKPYWLHRPVTVTGGASFIGSHLVDRLVELDADITVVDDLSSGRIGNIARHVRSGRVAFAQADLRQTGAAEESLAGADTVFHLAAAHGGRGYIETHQSACAENLMLDSMVFRAAARCEVRKVLYASSACVYPVSLQQDPARPIALSETMIGPPYDADGMYGWAKLMGEMTLATLHRECGITGVSCRYFGVYGPRASESHALIAMMARVVLGQDPIRIWGDGTQIRSWCFVSDIVEGTLRAAEEIDDASAVNLGTSDTMSVLDAVRAITLIADYDAAIEVEPSMPTGPRCRCGDFTRARTLLDWSPQVPFERGLRRTFRWYRGASQISAPQLESAIFERSVAPTRHATSRAWSETPGS